jgi:hypothetical protein
LIDGATRWLRQTLARPAGRDAVAVVSVLCMVAAVALWQPLVGLFMLGVAGLVIAVVVSFGATAGPSETEQGDGAGRTDTQG